MSEYFTEQTSFYGRTSPHVLVEKYGSPLYVYNESILRSRCREINSLLCRTRYRVNYSMKANSNVELLKVIREEGLDIDAVSEGEIYLAMLAGFQASKIFLTCSNVSSAEMEYAACNGVTVSTDSLSQLERYGRLKPGGKVAVRFNPGIGAGHHDKVVTGGKDAKFGINADDAGTVKDILQRYNLKLTGINQHIGSLFMGREAYVEGVRALLELAEKFEELEFVDFGGGFGTPYRKQEGQKRLDLPGLGRELDTVLADWMQKQGREITFKVEPGRYVTAESGVLLGTVHAVKQNYGKRYVGTDIGFNVLMRPVLYDSYHELEVYGAGRSLPENLYRVNVVGNICESGDVLAKERLLPEIREGDLIGVMDAGAYGYSMCSNYNSRLRPAEVLITADGTDRLIRRRDTFEELARNFSADVKF